MVAIVPSAGESKRMGRPTYAKVSLDGPAPLKAGKKEFLILGDRPILVHTLEPLEDHPRISEIILVVDEGNLQYAKKEIVEKYGFKKVREVIIGGEERQDSVYEALKKVAKDCDIVLIQDGARPFLTEELITKSIEEAKESAGAVVAVPATDTIKSVRDGRDLVIKTLEREYLWMTQTPQTFRYEIIIKAYEQAEEDNFRGTDDASLVERIKQPVKIVRGSYDNIKVTTPEDLILAEAILKKRNARSGMH